VRANDAIIGSIAAVVALLILGYAQTFPRPGHQPIGPAFFPSLIAVLMLAVAATLIVRGVRDYRGRLVEGAAWTARPAAWARVLAIPLAVLAYLALAPLIGFMPTAAAIVFGVAWLLGRRLVTALVLAVLSSAVIYAVFTRVFLVPLPVGPLEALLR
jgi:putative tricarboxylic transport membrane protein